MHYRGESQSALNKNWVFNALLCCTIYPSHSLLALYKNIKYQTEWERGPVDTRHSETLNFQIKILPIFHQLYFCQNKLSLPDTIHLRSCVPLLCQHSMASRFKLGPGLITRREKHSVLTITDLDWFCSVAYNLSLKEQERNGGGQNNCAVEAGGEKLNYLELETNEHTQSGLVPSLSCDAPLPLTRSSSSHWQ